LSIFLLKSKIKQSEFLALILATMGSILVIGFKLQNINFIGVMFGITAAVIYSFYIIVGSKATKGVDSFTASTVIISSSAFVYIIYAITNNVTIPTRLEQWKWLLAIAIISTIISIVTFFAGMKIIGPVKASMISTFEPIVTVLCSFWLLGEPLDIYQMLGAILIIIAALILAK
jgi:drug/metabolite transporter (DMT)-like permease